MAQEWREVLGKRTRTSKTKQFYVDGQATNQYCWDGQVGRSAHYLDAQGLWQDVDESAEEIDGEEGFTLKFTKLSYFGRIDGEGRRRFYPDRNDLSYWIEFKKPFANMGAPTRQGRWFYWNFAHAIIGVRFDVDSLKFGFRLKDAQAPTSITIPFETQGITRQGRLLLHDGEVVAQLRRPIAKGSNLDAKGRRIQKECDAIFVSGEVIISLDPTGLEYPIEIDPTVDKEVTAGGDDGYIDDNTFYALQDDLWTGHWTDSIGDEQSFFRFLDVTISGTITASYMTFDTADGGSGLHLKIYGVDEDNPAAPTNRTEYLADSLTSAAVDWDDQGAGSAQNTPSLNTIVQELVDSYVISGDAVMFQIRNDGTTGDLDMLLYSYEYSLWAGTEPPKLHIEYTAGGTQYSLVVDAGSYAVTGATVGLSIGRVMGASAGSYAVSGAAVGLIKDLLMGASAGSYALSGQAVNMPVDRVIGAGAGSYSLTGATVALLRDMLISAGAGSYAVTGTAVSLPITRVLSVASGSYAVSGAAVSLPVNRVMVASPGTYALSGAAASLLRDIIMSASGGSYAISGTAASLLLNWVLSASSGSYTITGSDVALLKTVLMAAGAGSYSLTGLDVTFLLGKVMSAGAGSYTITGSDTSFQISVSIVADAGSYSVTGQDVSLPIVRVMAADGSSYILTGSAANLLLNLVMQALGGSYVVTGQAIDFVLVLGAAPEPLTAKARSFALKAERAFGLHAPARDFDLTVERAFDLHAPDRDFDLTAED